MPNGIDKRNQDAMRSNKAALRYKKAIPNERGERPNFNHQATAKRSWTGLSAPDTVSVVIADNQQYYMKLQPKKKRYSLSKNTLTQRSGSIPLSSFVSGQQFMIAIERLRIDHIKQEEAFRVHWLMLVDVK